MSADDQTFLDTLSAVPNDVKRFSGDVADYVDRHVEKVAAVLRETLSTSQWLPESARPKPPPKPPINVEIVPAGLYRRVEDWVQKHKLLSGTFVVGIGAAVFFAYRRRKAYSRKRRAKRASNGARIEVVVIAGSPSEPLTRSLALDLERRGFIVFVVCNDVEEEMIVQNEARSDIRPLTIDISHSITSGNSIERLASYLQTPQHAFEGARPHHLVFSSLILIPSLSYPSAPVATVSPDHISDLLNTRLLHPILITQVFLPLLTSLPFPHPHHATPHAPQSAPHILLLTPTTISSLMPPFHAPESMIISALTAFTSSLAAELRPLSIPLIHLHLGAFDLSAVQPRNQLQSHSQSHHSLQAQRADMLRWPSATRGAYGKNFLSVAERAPSTNGLKGSPLRELHNAVFDAMGSKRGGTVRVGMGSVLYEFVGAWVPRCLVGWMMGLERVSRKGESSTGFDSRSESGSEGGVAATGTVVRDDQGVGVGMAGESEYISVEQ